MNDDDDDDDDTCRDQTVGVSTDRQWALHFCCDNYSDENNRTHLTKLSVHEMKSVSISSLM